MHKFVLFFVVLATRMGIAQDSLQFLFVGDVMQHGGQIAAAYNADADTYDYNDCFKFVRPIIERTDIAIANLEVTHAGKPYKGYPQFSAPPQLSEALVNAGFDVILTANNHSCDGGAKGIIGTLDVLEKLHVKHTGTFRSAAEREASYPLVIEKNGFKIAILNYTYGTNGLTVAPPLIVNYIDSNVMRKDFAKAKKMGVDYIVCTMHWGDEYKSLPNAYQQKWEKYCYELGADMVIGSHPHVLEPIEQKSIGGKDKLTVWSLGNYVSNQRDRYKDGGMMVRATIERSTDRIEIKRVEPILTWVYPRQEGKTKPFYILPEFNYNTYHAGFLSKEAGEAMEIFLSDSKKLFAVHNQGPRIQLFTPKMDSSLTQRYRWELREYYAVALSKRPELTKLPMLIQYDLHQITSSDGNYLPVFGFYATKEEAIGQMKFLQEIGISCKQVVHFSPSNRLVTPVIHE